MIEVDLPRALERIKRAGWLPANGDKDSAIGDAIESILGIATNNSRGP